MSSSYYISTFIFVFCGFFYFSTAGSFFDQKKLYSNLSDNINPHFRPVFDQSQALTVNVLVNILSIQEINEREQSLTSSFGISFIWTYETLRWNASEYGGIFKLTLFPDETWIPEVMLGNVLRNEPDLLQSNGMAVGVDSSGWTLWHSGGVLKTTCPIDISKYPFDTQTCVVVLSKAVPDSEVDLIPVANKVSRHVYIENEEWFLESSSTIKRPISSEISALDISLTLQRRPLFYIINIIVPVVMVSFLNILSFKIPPRCGERMSYCVALLLTFVVLLNSTGETMPRLSKHVSYLQVYINCQFMSAFLVTTVSALLVKAENSDTNIYLPRWLQMLLLKPCHRMAKVGAKNTETVVQTTENIEHNDDQKIEPSDTKVETNGELIKEKVIDCLDNVMFNIFVALFVISTLVCAVLILT